MPPVEASDLDEILTATRPLWEEMRGQRIFLTGGTGFFGTWLLESFLHANRSLTLGAEITLLTRRPEAFAAKSPHLTHDSAVTLLAGDVRDFDFPAGPFQFLIHGATEASAWLAANQPREMLSTIVQGTERVLQFAQHAGCRKLLVTSSGAIYGPQPHQLEHVSEDYCGAPDPLSPANVYGEGKRYAEMLAALAPAPIEVKIARCFAFVGPHLPLDTHFAIGNFLAAALAGRTVAVGGDGTSVRSYLYASDLVIWLWTILFQGVPLRAYNVGSEDAINIGDLARLAATQAAPPLAVTFGSHPVEGLVAARYVPSTERARRELGLRQSVTLEEGLRRTLAWHRLRS
jgi:nucleoside-diphosphate-sugar epimerase